MIAPIANLFYILTFMVFLTNLSYGAKQKSLCFTSTENSDFCKKKGMEIILLDKNATLDERIYQIQKSIRKELDLKEKDLILLGNAFDGTLLSIAQENMLTYYRKHIKGLVLKNSEPNYLEACKTLSSLDINNSCKLIEDFNTSLGEKVSYFELLKAISPSYQLDLYTPKVIIIDSNRRRVGEWKKLFKENAISYLCLEDENLHLMKWFPLKRSKKSQPKHKVVQPDHFGPLLRYHLWKITYRSKDEIVVKREIAYGSEPLQTYDLFYKKKSIKNPLLIYVHGGGWGSGDKGDFNDFCRQYADRGFTTVSINYRLMDLPKIGMKEMLTDVKNAIEHIFNNTSSYFIDLNRSVIMAESAGAQLAYLATTKLSKEYPIKVAVYNSIVSDLTLYSVDKQIELSGIKEEKIRKEWLTIFSPFQNLKSYSTKTLALHGIDDKVVLPKHLEVLEIYSVINFNNITSLWVKNASHPLSLKNQGMQPSYLELDRAVYKFISSNIN